jgi:sensor domain CHASE-containing protein
MRLTQRTLLIVAPTLLLATLAIYALGRLTLYPSFEALEREQAATNAERLLRQIEGEYESITASVEDWGYWDDTYRFLDGENPGYIDDNLAVDSQLSLRNQLFALYDRHGRRAWARALDLESGQSFALPPFDQAYLPPTHPLLSHDASPRIRRGLMATPRGPMLMVAAPVLDSDRNGPSRGTLIMGRLLDRERLRRLSERSLTRVEFSHASSRAAGAGLPATGVDLRLRHTPIRVAPRDGELVASTELLDLEGRPGFRIDVLTGRQITARGQASLRTSAAYLGGAMLLFAGLLMWLLRSQVLRPLAVLTDQAEQVAAGPEREYRLRMQREDEIGDLSRSLDRMLERLAQTRRRLLEQSYRAGGSEIARGVVRDLQRVIVPMNEGLERPLRLLDQTRHVDLQLILRELADRQTDAGRRQDLLARLQDALGEQATLLAETRGELRLLRKRLEELRRTTDEFAEFADSLPHPNAPIDLAAMVEAAYRHLGEERRAGLTLTIEDSVRRIDGLRASRDVLQRVLNEVVAAAVDGLHALEGHGELHVIARSEGESTQRRIELRLHDNRPTPGDEEVANYLQPRTPSDPRPDLSWAAAAVAGMGGELVASAAHPYEGLLLSLRLPLDGGPGA